MAIARRQHGLLTADDLNGFGYGGRARNQALDSGTLVRLHRGVYRLGSHEMTFEQRAKAAILAAPDAVVSGPTAGRFWNLRGVWSDDVHILARRAICLTGVHAHRTDLLGSGDIVEKFGVRLLGPARLMCDLARFVDEDVLESVLEQLLDRRALTIEAMRRTASRFCRPGRPGSREVTSLLDRRPDRMEPVGSDLELRVWRGLASAGHVLERQVQVEIEPGRTVRLDLASRECRLGIEVDHRAFHEGRLDVQGDKQRDRLLTALGWSVVRITDDDVDRRFAATIDQLVHILDHRLADVRRAS